MRVRLSMLIIVLLAGNGLAIAQQPPMRAWLNTGTGEQKMQRLVAMGVDREAAEAVAISLEPEVEWLPLHTKSNQQLAILFLPCSGDVAYAYLMERIANEWKAEDSESFDCHYDDSVFVELGAMADNTVEDLFVHHACVEHGIGGFQQNFQVFAIRSMKLNPVLDTAEILKSDNDDLDDYERSSFVVVPTPAGRVIEETLSTTLNGRLIVERRYFRWVASKGGYRPSRFVPVSVQVP